MTQTKVMPWRVSRDHGKPKKGYRLYRVGTNGDSRYFTEDLPDILAIIKSCLKEADVWREGPKKTGVWGSNYIIVIARKNRQKAFEEACFIINEQIPHVTEAKALFGKKVL